MMVVWFRGMFSEEIFLTQLMLNFFFFILYLKLLFRKCATYVLGCSACLMKAFNPLTTNVPLI